MNRLDLDCEELLNWWEPKADISYIFRFNWRSLQQLREAVTLFLSARLHSVSMRARKAVTETGCKHLKAIVASNPETPSDMLDYLTYVSTNDILVRIAENPNTSSQTLSRLALHEDVEVRVAVAENANSPSSCLERLIEDECVDVRFRLAENPNAPLPILYKALRDENPYVISRSKKTLARILTNTISLSAQMMMSEDTDIGRSTMNDEHFAEHLMAELNQTLGFHPSQHAEAMETSSVQQNSSAQKPVYQG